MHTISLFLSLSLSLFFFSSFLYISIRCTFFFQPLVDKFIHFGEFGKIEIQIYYILFMAYGLYFNFSIYLGVPLPCPFALGTL